MRRHEIMLTLLIMFSTPVLIADEVDDYVHPYPPAGDGMARYVIKLPHKERKEAAHLRVEILVGQEMFTDGINTITLEGDLETKQIEGWGRVYYELAKFGPSSITALAVHPRDPPVKEFVAGPALTIPYNSRVPIVIYVPEDAEVRFRVWKAKAIQEASKG